jgi:hypothetical protein
MVIPRRILSDDSSLFCMNFPFGSDQLLGHASGTRADVTDATAPSEYQNVERCTRVSRTH